MYQQTHYRACLQQKRCACCLMKISMMINSLSWGYSRRSVVVAWRRQAAPNIRDFTIPFRFYLISMPNNYLQHALMLAATYHITSRSRRRKFVFDLCDNRDRRLEKDLLERREVTAERTDEYIACLSYQHISRVLPIQRIVLTQMLVN